jgi:hypothetical protein
VEKKMLSRLWALASGNWKVTCSLSTASIIGCILVGLLVAWRDGDMTLASMLGILVGWSTGILLAPYDEERRRFAQWSKSLVGLLAGLSLAKLDIAFKFASEHNPHSFRIIGIALSWLMLTAITVFVVRTYSKPVDKK